MDKYIRRFAVKKTINTQTEIDLHQPVRLITNVVRNNLVPKCNMFIAGNIYIGDNQNCHHGT